MSDRVLRCCWCGRDVTAEALAAADATVVAGYNAMSAQYAEEQNGKIRDAALTAYVCSPCRTAKSDRARRQGRAVGIAFAALAFLVAWIVMSTR